MQAFGWSKERWRGFGGMVFLIIFIYSFLKMCHVYALTPLPDTYAKYKWVLMFSSWKLYNSLYRMHMPNMSKSTTLEPLASLQKLMTRNIWKKLQSMKTVLLGYGGFKFALKLRTFRWLPQMIAYVPQKSTQSNFPISTIRLIYSSFDRILSHCLMHLSFIELFSSSLGSY